MLYTVTVESSRRTGAAALGLVLAVMVFLVGRGRPQPGARRATAPARFVPVALANVIAWMTGYSVRQRRLYVVTLQQQAASSAVAEERLRIARELHDVVAHSMSVIAVQAGYGQYVIDASPDGARDALGAIQATSRDALEEMRRMLGVLRQQDVTPGPAPGRSRAGQAPAGGGRRPAAQPRQAPLAPAPGLAGLDRLIERTRGAGVRVTLEVSGHARPAPAGVDLSAYRIIQEALTNVVRHAGTGASCVVSLGYTDADLVIRVTDDGGLPVALPSVSVASRGDRARDHRHARAGAPLRRHVQRRAAAERRIPGHGGAARCRYDPAARRGPRATAVPGAGSLPATGGRSRRRGRRRTAPGGEHAAARHAVPGAVTGDGGGRG